jgi:hypothetical protein
VEAEILTESDFTVRVDNLPEDCTDRMELKCFFEGCAGAVSDVVMYVDFHPDIFIQIFYLSDLLVFL